MEERTLIDNFLDSAVGFNFPQNILGEYSPLSLAFMGDAIFEVYVRTYILSKGNTTPHKLHIAAANFVKAKSQAKAMNAIVRHLTEDEAEVARRGRNAKSGTVPKNADVTEYRRATGLECLFGYLYLTGKTERLMELLEISTRIIEN